MIFMIVTSAAAALVANEMCLICRPGWLAVTLTTGRELTSYGGFGSLANEAMRREEP